MTDHLAATPMPVDGRRLTRTFFARGARDVAVDLLGKRLVRIVDGDRVSGAIVETEAYCHGGGADLACHGSKNRGRPTARTAVMFGPPGHAYVYFTYGMHWLFNVVTGAAGAPNAVLVRAVAPVEGEARMAARRRGRSGAPLPRGAWTSGPAKLTEALGIDGRLHGADLCAPDAEVWLEDAPPVPPERVGRGPRIGLGGVPEPWLSRPWRFWVAGDPFVSRPPPAGDPFVARPPRATPAKRRSNRPAGTRVS